MVSPVFWVPLVGIKGQGLGVRDEGLGIRASGRTGWC